MKKLFEAFGMVILHIVVWLYVWQMGDAASVLLQIAALFLLLLANGLMLRNWSLQISSATMLSFRDFWSVYGDSSYGWRIAIMWLLGTTSCLMEAIFIFMHMNFPVELIPEFRWRIDFLMLVVIATTWMLLQQIAREIQTALAQAHDR